MQAVEPQIAELLRTTIHPPSLLLRVAHVEFVKAETYHAESFTSNSDNEGQSLHRKNGFLGKFLLSDGELMIQALLHRRLSGLEDVGSVEKGDLLDIRRFTVNKAPRLNSRGKVVFLGIEDCTFLLKPATEQAQGQKDAQQYIESSTVTKKRARIEEDDTFGKKSYSGSTRKLLAHSSPKRVRMSVPEPDDLVLPSSIPSTPPLSLSEVDAFIAAPKNDSFDRIKAVSPAAKSSASRSSKKRNGFHRNNDRVDRTFGARTLMSDDEDDEEDFFESIQTIRTPAKVARAIIHNPYYSPQTSFRSNKKGSVVSPGLFKSTRHAGKEVPEPQLPPPPISRRDGTFALSQSVSFYQAQVAPRHPMTAPQQDRPKSIVKNAMIQTNPTQQSSLLPVPPFYTLQILRHPPPTQSLPKNNFTVTVLAVISWVGTSILHRAGSPFPPKRHLKIVDPSLTASRPESRESHIPPQVSNLANTSAPRSSNNLSVFKPQSTFQDSVTVAVYVDAADFKPAAGTIALFRGLVMQRLANGDIILNAYGRLKDQRFADSTVEAGAVDAGQYDSNSSHWFMTDPERIRALGYGGKMDYYREWWDRKQSAI